MELNLPPIATTCRLSGTPFAKGDRVVSALVDNGPDGGVARLDMLEAEAGQFAPDGRVVCRWTQVFKPREPGENPERALKLTAENLFLALMDPASELSPENTPLARFLALMLERKRILRPKGRTPDGSKNILEHAGSKTLYEVPAGELTPEFFLSIQEQIGALLGIGRKTPAAAPPETAAA